MIFIVSFIKSCQRYSWLRLYPIIGYKTGERYFLLFNFNLISSHLTIGMNSLLITSLCDFLNSDICMQTNAPFISHSMVFENFMLKISFIENNVEFIIIAGKKSIKMSKNVFQWFVKHCGSYTGRWGFGKWQYGYTTYKDETETYTMQMFGEIKYVKTCISLYHNGTGYNFLIEKVDMEKLYDLFNSLIKFGVYDKFEKQCYNSF